MDNVFFQDSGKSHNTFKWENLGDIKNGRGDLGEDMPVLVYRLMQYTMLDVLTKQCGAEKADQYFREAGFLAGTEFAKNTMDLSVSFDQFISVLQGALLTHRIGIFRMESFNPETSEIMVTVAQDLDCSGLPVSNETVCTYDEGFIAGILFAYTGKRYTVREVDCWANGNRVCRFQGVVEPH